jgi:hypothetical protein
MERTRTIKNVTPAAVDDLIYKTGAELEDTIEGVLLDDLLFWATPTRLVMAIETPANEWSSLYTVIYGNPAKIYAKWEERKEAAAAAAAEIEAAYIARLEA